GLLHPLHNAVQDRGRDDRTDIGRECHLVSALLDRLEIQDIASHALEHVIHERPPVLKGVIVVQGTRLSGLPASAGDNPSGDDTVVDLPGHVQPPAQLLLLVIEGLQFSLEGLEVHLFIALQEAANLRLAARDLLQPALHHLPFLLRDRSVGSAAGEAVVRPPPRDARPPPAPRTSSARKYRSLGTPGCPPPKRPRYA